MASVPHCNGAAIVEDESIRYLPNQHIYVGCFYLVFFCAAIIPQFFLMYTCLEKHNVTVSCYKLMIIVCFCDMINLFNCMLTAGIFTMFEIQHCKSGMWVVYYGQFVMFFWYAYCIANLILAFNRLFEFLNKRLTELLFDGHRCWLWALGVALYAGCLCGFAPQPFYFYDADAGVWYFFWLTLDPTNYFHIYNNLIKLGLMVCCYILMLVLLRRKLAGATNSVSDVQKRLSIQACLIASACAGGNITYLIISYLPMGNSPITGMIGETLWGIQHSAGGFVYILMNKAVKKNVLKFLTRIGCKNIGTKVINIKPSEARTVSVVTKSR